MWGGHEKLVQQLRALNAPGKLTQSKPLGRICGTVRDDQGALKSHVTVYCRSRTPNPEDRFDAWVGRDGRFCIEELRPGTYDLSLKRQGKIRQTVVLSNHNEVVENVDLRISQTESLNQELLDCASRGRGRISKLLAQGADPNARDPDNGSTPLQHAASEPTTRPVTLLLEAGARVDATNQYGKTALMRAVENNCRNNVRVLLKAGADIHLVDHMHCSALHLACEKGNQEIAMILIDAGADLQQTNRHGRTPRDEAVWEGHPDLADALRAQGAPGTLAQAKPSGSIRGVVVDEAGEPMRNVRLQVMRMTEAGDRSGGGGEVRTSADGSFALRQQVAGCYRFASASRLDAPTIVCLTNDWDAQTDVRVQVPRRCIQEAEMYSAVSDNDAGATLRLLAAGADPRATDCENRSLLEMALNQWATNVVPALLSHGADLNAPNADGITPLRRAASTWSSWKIPYLLRLGAAVRPERGGSPLLLIDVTRRDPTEDENMQHFRLRHLDRCAKTARLLIQAGASVGVRDEEGMTPLHHAAQNGYAECVDVLLKAGADRNATNAGGQTAFEMALEHQQRDVVQVLRNHGVIEPDSEPAKGPEPHGPEDD